MKCAACKDMGVDCPWVGKAETMEELGEMTKKHAMEAHKEWWEETGSKMSAEENMEMLKKVAKEC